MKTDNASAPAGGEPPLLESRDGAILILRLNRPSALNAVTAEMSQLAGEALERAEADREIGAVVITGAGSRAFSAGADLKELAAGKLPYATQLEWGFAGIAEHFISKPVIAAVNGLAFGGGLEIAVAADLVIASRDARFALPEVRVGVIAGAGGLIRLPKQIPFRAALSAALTGEPFDAEDALRWGLANRVVDASDVLSSACDLARQICRNAPLAVQASKRIVHGARDRTIPDEQAAWEINNHELRLVQASEDAREGPRAFAERREPRWHGR